MIPDRKARALRRDAIARYMADALGEPRCVTRTWARTALGQERLFWKDYDSVLKGSSPDSRWTAIDFRGPMFYESYAELARRDQPIVVLMPHMSCFVSALFYLHRFSPRDRSILAFRRSGGPERTARLFEALGRTGVPVDLIEAGPGAAAIAYARLRRGGVLFAFQDVPVRPGEDPPTDRVAVDFLGLPVLLPVGAVRLAALTGARLLFLSVFSPTPRCLRICLEDLWDGDARAVENEAFADDLLTRVVRVMERTIERAPTEWLQWTYLGEMWKEGTCAVQGGMSTRSSSGACAGASPSG